MESYLTVGTVTTDLHFNRLLFVLSIPESFNKRLICAVLRLLSSTRLVEGGAKLHSGDDFPGIPRSHTSHWSRKATGQLGLRKYTEIWSEEVCMEPG